MSKWKAEMYKKLFWGMVAVNIVLSFLLVSSMMYNLELVKRIN